MNTKRLMIVLMVALFLLLVPIVQAQAGISYNAANISLPPVRLGQQTTEVRLDFYSPRGFPISSSLYILWIGNRLFIGGNSLTSDQTKISFFLTPAEFASVNNGDEVVIKHISSSEDMTAPPTAPGILRVRFFGPLNKNKLSMNENLLLTQQKLIAVLTTVRTRLLDSQDKSNLDAAIQYLNAATAHTLWLDGLHLQVSSGATVYNATLNAINSLQLITTDWVMADINGVKNDLAYIDIALAGLAIGDAEKAGGDPPKIAQAEKALDQGVIALSAVPRQPANAVTYSRNAWQLAQDARVRIPTPIPTSSPSAKIKITLIIPDGIPLQNELPRLTIGDKEFLCNGIYRVVCVLTREEFDSLTNGDQVLLAFDKIYVFGPLNKNKLTMTVQLKPEQ